MMREVEWAEKICILFNKSIFTLVIVNGSLAYSHSHTCTHFPFHVSHNKSVGNHHQFGFIVSFEDCVMWSWNRRSIKGHLKTKVNIWLAGTQGQWKNPRRMYVGNNFLSAFLSAFSLQLISIGVFIEKAWRWWYSTDLALIMVMMMIIMMAVVLEAQPRRKI